MKEIKALIMEYQSAPEGITIERVKDAIGYMRELPFFNALGEEEKEEWVELEFELQDILEEIELRMEEDLGEQV